jgi:hypothetical protein
MPPGPNPDQKLDRILFELQSLSRKVDKMTVNQSQFDAGLATLVANDATREAVLQTVATNLATLATNVTAIGTALTQFITDYQNKSGVDLTNELASVTTLANTAATDATSLSSDASSASAAAASLGTDTSNITGADPNA